MVEANEPNARFFKLRLIWIALFACLGFYLLYGLMSVGIPVHTGLQSDMSKVSMKPETITTLRTVLYPVAFILFIAARYLKGRALSPAAGGVQSPQAAAERYFLSVIGALVLSEGVALFGLVLIFTGKNLMDLYVCLFIAFCSMILFRPKREEFEEMIKQAGRVSQGR